jgi:uncharacterized C2H2 Zn-finger protein
MTYYSCGKCNKQFNQEEHYNKHINKKRTCVSNKKEKIDLFISKDLKYTINTEMPTLKIKHNLGQYFTTHHELKEKVFEFILNKPSNILEPGIKSFNFLSQLLYV